MAISIIQPKIPKNMTGWREVDASKVNNFCYAKRAFYFAERGLCVISAVEVAEQEKGGEDIGAVYHISISKNRTRCTSNEAKWVLRQFALEEAEEDNHVPNGFVRNFFRPVADKFFDYQCPCQKSEPTIRQDKGDFIWRPAPR